MVPLQFMLYLYIITVTDSDIYKRMVEMENLAETRLKAISVLESQKFDLVQGKFILFCYFRKLIGQLKHPSKLSVPLTILHTQLK